MEWPAGCWFSVENRDAVLADPRNRFLTAIQVFTAPIRPSANPPLIKAGICVERRNKAIAH
jgi:hypothetical protein